MWVCNFMTIHHFTEPSKVRNLAVQSTSPTSLSLSWQQPDDQYCSQDLREYKIQYQATNRGQCGQVSDEVLTYSVLNLNETRVAINNLASYSTYRVFVVARNSMGSENASETLVSTLEDRK